MDHFETIICDLLEATGYWIRRSFKVEITKEEKRRIGRHSMPRPEIDILAYKREADELLVLEAKSFLDSPGVSLDQLPESHDTPQGRYKLFTCDNYRKIVFERLRLNLIASGMITSRTNLRLGLAAGKVYRRESDKLQEFMDSKGWFFFSPAEIRAQLTRFADIGYENNPSVITTKILMRDQ
jgi:hypothetical protein